MLFVYVLLRGENGPENLFLLHKIDFFGKKVKILCKKVSVL